MNGGSVCFVSPSLFPVCAGSRSNFNFKVGIKPSFAIGPANAARVNNAAEDPTTTSSRDEEEIRVCVNRTCRRQGSLETLQVLSGIAPPHVTVKSCGCLGRCGAGPNLVVLPRGTSVAHCGTPSRAVHAMMSLCGGDPDSWSNSLEALALRKRAQDELGKGDSSANASQAAELLLSQAVNLKPYGGIHVLYKDRCVVRLVMGNIAGALEDAKQAISLAPKYYEAYICQGDALIAMDQFDAAEMSYAIAAELDPSIRQSKSFKARIVKLRQKFIAAGLPQVLPSS
ncbi:uncharacterized protein LOC127797088 isoform X2 [Diospyros lotus]|uniref:uncharacterized protein LOC127797088 isoform X2 n=1 Tax=Diospyros lotus TaxID=55363 RepID=UPI0022538508|nr:uncharacterized protein LOC127797088 isoform X2 [Diospyros lotus]XP_052185575.1 uncharacterized protein LOC127797088 isoform X2 [Diospyros lotus]